MSENVSRRGVLLGSAATLAVAGTPFLAGAAQAATAPFPGPLKYGATGPNVTLLQQSLGAAGFWMGTADGSFGPMTLQGVYALQKANGYSRTGVVDEITWNRAMQRVRALPRFPGSSGLEVDLKRQLLMVVSAGVSQLTLNTSTGSGAYFYSGGKRMRAVTPTGTFKIYRKSTNEGSSGWVSGTLGEMYRPRFFTTQGHAVHGSSEIPPYPASHGCCRLSVQAQNKLLAINAEAIGRYIRIY